MSTLSLSLHVGIYDSSYKRLFQISTSAAPHHVAFRYGNTVFQDSTPILSENTIYDLKLTPDGGYVNSSKECESASVEEVGSYIITGYMPNRSSVCTTALQIRTIEVFENDNLLLQCIPALDFNKIPCLYDLVNGTTYYTARTGDFLYKLKE